mmetsp:Transcript_96260/g.167174  ORF Transcript_96260/g.167174 Transcript_96260/m.167174 type:complete len:134 (-) Transcript_96260:73-474(-)
MLQMSPSCLNATNQLPCWVQRQPFHPAAYPSSALCSALKRTGCKSSVVRGPVNSTSSSNTKTKACCKMSHEDAAKSTELCRQPNRRRLKSNGRTASLYTLGSHWGIAYPAASSLRTAILDQFAPKQWTGGKNR